MLVLLARTRNSKAGILLTVLGVLILFAFLVLGLVSVAGSIILMVNGTGPVIDFLGTGWGVLTGLVIAVVIIWIGVIFLMRAAPQAAPHRAQVGAALSGLGPEEAPASSPTDPEEVERLNTRLDELEQENERLRREAVEDDRGVAHFGSAVLPETQEDQSRKEYANRYLLTLALKDVREEARLFLSAKPTYARAEEWAKRAFELIQKSLGDDKAKYFDDVLRLGWHDEDPYSPPNPDAPNEEDALQRAVEVLDRLIGLVTSSNCPKLKDHFDGRKWVSGL